MQDPFHPNEARTASGHARSWYAETALGLRMRGSLDGDRRTTVAIVGGGITGCSAALHLAKRGIDVTVLEARRIGWGASGRNGGQLLSGQRVEQSTLEEIAGPEDARCLWTLAQEAIALVRKLIDHHSIACDLRDGALMAAAKPAHFDHLKAEAAHLAQSYDYDGMRVVPPDQMTGYVASKRYHGGLWDKNSGHLQPLTYTAGLAAAAEEAGAVFYETTPVTALLDGPPLRLRTARGIVTAEHIVLAGNGYLLDVIPEHTGTILPIHSFVGVTAPLPGSLAARLIPCGGCVADTNMVLDYYRMTPDGRLLLGGGESYGRDLPSLDHISRIIGARMAHVFPQLRDIRPETVWGGRLAITLNRMPHIARPRHNLYLAQGYSGHGLAIATLAGSLIADAITGVEDRFGVYDRLVPPPLPGGPAFRHPLMMLAMLWGKLRDTIG